MIKYEFKDRHNDIFVRVNKLTARKLFYKYYDIVLCPSNLRPFSMFNPQYVTNLLQNQPNFDEIVENFKYYNCTDAYTGRTVYYYVRRDIINND